LIVVEFEYKFLPIKPVRSFLPRRISFACQAEFRKMKVSVIQER